ncbi:MULTISPECIES: UDP-2,4-diacetamido-2,4,6-trideoxy-beta-L-altropyranose hydrolase [unclassified Clostridium]|uniref:UDP-2,4-diacetamido-2,4, 6-trideoxy-beta-L-altropyranose hydrolase n=1 Tax=unclassified Clostridium TaxID=2614128 RepID=UPI0013FB285F|nr:MULTISPECIES: UDP-2,4-diacetamido-2,4,6-trideoxy-beta-L-altropyranose hydrolase [unclassified Clostridium]NFT06919.1 UDP-2,4-diacetamido-2,4,6-trideoxy-beta-L-altropyranose hydrolase [Clostridium botulinum]
MKIAIRADGGAKIGMGHIMRTLVLAKELSKTHDVFYICRVNNPLSEKYRIGIEKIKSWGFVVKTIREDFILFDLKDMEVDLLITDSYDVDENYFNATKKMFNQTAYIDDMNLYYFNVDFLINQNIDGVDFDYKVNTDTKLLIGSNYIMLREEFRDISEKYIKEKVNDIMITVGGADPYHITEQILDYVKILDYKFHVVVGPSFEKDNYLKEFESLKVKLYYNANMYEVMQKCDIAISACGSTLYELSACGVPTIGLIIADNQQGLANKMDGLGIIKNIGWYNKLFKNKFIEDLTNLCNNIKIRREMSGKAQKFVDGNGVKRISLKLF